MIKGGKPKSGQGPAEKQENLGEKLRGGGKRGGHTTPVLQPSWRLQRVQLSTGSAAAQDSSIINPASASASATNPFPSARKLAANLWELHQYDLPLSKMQQQGVSSGAAATRHRRHQQNHLHRHHHHHFPDPSPTSPDLGSAGSLRRHIAASLMQHHRAIQSNHHAIQPVSPASYGSSMEVTPYNPAVTPTSSIEFRGGIGETSYSLKTSTELLKVLNRIWSLEEQHATNVSLVRALKKELDQARAKIKELVLDQQADRQEMDELLKQIAEDKLGRKEQDRVSAAIQSVRDELEEERKLRKRSETLHRKLARELYEVKTSLASSLKDLEKERKSRKLLEELCDEFAWGIKNYEQEMHSLKYKSEKNLTNRADRDGLILHISESWLDERMQIKQEPQFGYAERNSVLDKLSSEIESFLQAKRNGNYSGRDGSILRGPKVRRNSLESIPLNLAASAPQDQGDEVSSAGSDSHCFELDKPVGYDFKPEGDEGKDNRIAAPIKPNHAKKKLTTQERTKDRSPSNLQVKFEEHMAQAVSGTGIKNLDEETEGGKNGEENTAEISILKKFEIHEATEEAGLDRKNKANETRGSNSNYIDSLIRSHYLLSDNGNMQPESDYVDSCGNSVWRSHASPVRQWTTKLPTKDLEISESTSKLPPNLKDNTLKEKLLEARARGQRSRSRLKASKVPF